MQDMSYPVKNRDVYEGNDMDNMQGENAVSTGEVKTAEELAGRLERCGHFMAHCLGGRRGQGKILRLLESQGDMSQKELQDRLGIQPGSMSEIAAKLETRGLIVRTRDAVDKRKILLSITQLGREELERHCAAQAQLRDETLFSALTGEEREQLAIMMDKLLTDWETRFGQERLARRCRSGGRRGPEEPRTTVD